MQTSPLNFFETLLSHSMSRNSFDSMPDWFECFIKETKYIPSTLEQAALGGRLSNNMSFAFAAGYQSAIQSLFKPDYRQLSSLCISEHEGNHPRAIKCSLTQHGQNRHLNGSKSFITGANEAEFLYVAATTGFNINNRPNIKMLSFQANLEGIKIRKMKPLPFVPEISHGTATFKQVTLKSQQILEGDGYTNFVKPFRTHEDIHVLAAIIGFRIGEAIDSNWSHDSVEAHLSLLASLLPLEPNNFNQASTHLILAGCRSQLKVLIQQTDDQFKQNNIKGFEEWRRDKALLEIASKAHKIRTNRAWDILEGNGR